ncbi:hypothetical protein ACFW1A_13790 [Kitasatospora sp. NPDC058965]|uniref:hypothetical protein n=1 Tax=Kitasatospora sp. NPDC058965 TaxID=3346682 RepID=UPI0036857432
MLGSAVNPAQLRAVPRPGRRALGSAANRAQLRALLRPGRGGGTTRGANKRISAARRRPEGLPTLQALAAVSASFVGILFVILNVGYVSYFEGLGVHPEQVGFDRAAVLGRTASIALVGIFLAMTILVGIAGFRGWLGITDAKWREFRKRAWVMLLVVGTMLVVGLLSELVYGIVTHRFYVLNIGLMVPLIIILVAAGSVQTPKAIIGASLVVLAFLGIFLWQEQDGLHRRVQSVRSSNRPIESISFAQLPVIDIATVPVRPEWLDKSSDMPQELSDPRLLYLGRDAGSVAFVACGRSFVVPSAKVGIVTLPKSSEAVKDDARTRFCGCVLANSSMDCREKLSPNDPPPDRHD